MAKKATTTKENPVEEKSIGITPEMEELKKQKVEQEKEVQNYIMEQAKESDKFEGKNLLTIDFRVTATKEQFMAIREFFGKNNINYGRI